MKVMMMMMMMMMRTTVWTGDLSKTSDPVAAVSMSEAPEASMHF